MKTLKNNGGNPKPTANLTINKNRVKVYDNGTYYLKNGQTFEIELFNPTTSKVRADITIDGRLVTGGGLVLNPGQRAYLERFVDSNNKFLFETYEVEDSDEIKEAISNNGRLKVEFYRETVNLYNTSGYTWTNYGFDPSKHPNYPIVTYYGNNFQPINGKITDSNTPYYSNDFTVTTNTSGNDFTVTPIDGSNVTLNNNIEKTNYVLGADFANGPDSTVNCYYSTSIPFDTPDSHNDILRESAISTTETGRTEKGEASDQTFDWVNASFDFLPFETVEYNLLPISKKMVTPQEASYKHYCSECGGKVKDKFKFCPRCGEKL